MAIIESPTDARVQQEVDPSFGAARVSVRPLDFKTHDGKSVGGHYRTVAVSGLTTVLVVGDAILSLRWGLSANDRLFVLNRLRAFATISTVFGAGQEISLDIIRVNGFTASDTGGSAVVGAGLNAGAGRKSINGGMQPSFISDLRVAAAVALGAGTGTAEAVPCGFCTIPVANVVGASAGEDVYDTRGIEHPLTLGPNEGFRVRIGFTQGAAGVVRYSFVLDWAEIPRP